MKRGSRRLIWNEFLAANPSAVPDYLSSNVLHLISTSWKTSYSQFTRASPSIHSHSFQHRISSPRPRCPRMVLERVRGLGEDERNLEIRFKPAEAFANLRETSESDGFFLFTSPRTEIWIWNYIGDPSGWQNQRSTIQCGFLLSDSDSGLPWRSRLLLIGTCILPRNLKNL